MGRTTSTLQKRIEELQTQLNGIVDPREQLPILDELSFHFAGNNTTEAEKYARKGLDIAVRINEKFWIAQGYINLGRSLGTQSLYESEIRYLRKAWKLHSQLPVDSYVRAKICFNLGRSYFQQGNTRIALEWIEKSFGFAGESGDLRVIASAHAFAGTIYRNLGWYGKALRMFDEALKAYETLSYTQGIALIEWDIGQLYAGLEDWDTAIARYEKSRLLNRQVGDRQLEGFLYRGLGVAYTVKGEYAKALRLYGKAHALFEELKDAHQSAQSLMQIGYLYRYQNRLDAAHEKFCQALEMFEAIKSRPGQSFALIGIGLVCLHRKEWESVIDVVTRAMRIRRPAGGVIYQRDAHSLLAEAYEHTGNVSSALKHYKRYMEFEHMLLADNVLEKLRAVEMREEARKEEEGSGISRARAEQLEREAGKGSVELNAVSGQLTKNMDLLVNLRKRLGELKNSSDTNRKAIDTLLRQIEECENRMKALKTFEDRMQKYDRAYAHMLSTTFASLTPMELRICTMLKIGLSNAQIVDLLNVSARTIDTHRAHVRKKLGLPRNQNLIEFLSRVG